MSSVLIKDVDKQLYSRFKAEAALRGIKIGEALQLAMKKWLENQSTNNEIETQRIRNNAVFRQLLPNLIEEHKDQWIVISNGQLKGIVKHKNEAIQMIEDLEIMDQHNLISPITKTKRKVRMGFGRIIT